MVSVNNKITGALWNFSEFENPKIIQNWGFSEHFFLPGMVFIITRTTGKNEPNDNTQ